VNDFTKRGGGMAAVALSEPLIQALLDHHPHPVLVTDPQGHIKAANRAAGWLLKANEPGMLQDLTDAGPWRSAVAEGKAWSGTLPIAVTGGASRHMHVTTVAAPADDRHRISFLVPAESVDQATDARFRIIADSAPVMIWISGPDRSFDWFNKPWLAFTGRTLTQLRGDGWLADVHPEDTERCVAIYRTSFDERLPFTMDYRLRRQDGQYRWVLDNGVPRFDERGQFEGYIGSCVDIHERKELEERLAAHTQTMRLADRRQNEFLAMLSHQLRSPLAPISNAASVLRTLENGHPTLVRLREIIERQVGRLRRLVDDLVDVTRVMQGQITLVKSRVAVRDLLRSAVETSQSKLDAAGHTLRIDAPNTPLFVLGDSVRLAQALSNILSNAATFTPEPSVISLAAKASDGTLHIAVRDEGQGITAEFLPYVFDLFARHDLQSGGKPGGLGLGLPLARRVAQLHGGDVKAYSEGAGRGAEFVLTLPLAAADEAASQGPAAAPAAPHTSTYRVLLIEENPDSRYLTRLQIELWGHQVATAGTVDEALRLIDGFRPEVVLCDVEGSAALRAAGLSPLRERLGHSAAFIALSAYGHQEDEANARALGFDAVLEKPLRPDGLNRAVDAIAHTPAVNG